MGVGQWAMAELEAIAVAVQGERRSVSGGAWLERGRRGGMLARQSRKNVGWVQTDRQAGRQECESGRDGQEQDQDQDQDQDAAVDCASWLSWAGLGERRGEMEQQKEGRAMLAKWQLV